MLIVAAVFLNEADYLINFKINAVAEFSSEAISDWAGKHLSQGCAVPSDVLDCFHSVITAGCSHEAIVAAGMHPNDLPQFRWINILLGSNQNTSFSFTFHVFNFDRCARRYRVASATDSTGGLRWR